MCVALTAKGFPPNGEVFSVTLVQKLASVPSFCGAKTSTRLFTADFLGGGGTDAVQKLASVPIFELRVFRSKNSIELVAQDGNRKVACG